MAVNLASKYAKEIATAFTLKSVVEGTTNTDYDFTGVKKVHVWTPVTQPLNDYSRTGTNRYGTPTELQDTDQELEVTKDRAFSITVDKGNNTEQENTKDGAKMLRLEIDEQVTPEMDDYSLGKYTDYAGKIVALASAPTTETICGALSDGMVAMSNANVPDDNRFIFIGWTCFGLLRLSKQFIGVDVLAKEALVRGSLGTFMGAQVIPVPDAYLKKGTNVCYFLITHKNSVIQVKKIQDYFIKDNPAGINGVLLEGRFIFDAYVLGGRKDGVYAAIAASTRQATPTIAVSGTTATITSSGATEIRVTLDGTDPRYNSAATKTTSGGTLTVASGDKIRAVAFDDALFTSDIAEETVS